MIDVKDLTKKYGSREVVSGIDLNVKTGDVLGFIGPNGAGKSTTIKMLSGVLPVYAGSVMIDGIDIATDPRKAKNRIGYLPENAPLPPNMTVRAFLLYVASMRGIPFFSRKKALADAAKSCALENVLDQEIESLSKGYKRRVCFAQAIIHKPSILLLDEPTDGLDPNQKREIRNLIQILRKNTAIIISTHILEEVRSVCSKVLLLSGGKIVFNGSTDEFTTQEQQVRCVAITVPGESLFRTAELLREKFPGSCRLDGDRIIVPEDLAEDPAFRALLEAEGLATGEQTPSPATLDDVFAFLTRRDPEKTVPAETEKQTADPVENQEEDDDE